MCLCVKSGPAAKRAKKGEQMSEEELKKNRLQRRKELKRSRQQASRKEMFEVINQSKQVWEDLRRCVGHKPRESGVKVPLLLQTTSSC